LEHAIERLPVVSQSRSKQRARRHQYSLTAAAAAAAAAQCVSHPSVCHFSTFG